ncbi:MFS transporter [Desulfonema magnum]|uniref:Major facilitator superfamily transporter n=1 Tax=Desulfonema magnum TaxID=45655 RepID=A0A975BW74_9BACT|nr:MFS transporter [Desulfonema magnum]QTA92512.1 Major facilitator superfamily transporter [Desulfonema magnum]
MTKSDFHLQFIVFALVSAAFTNIYITQPILPVLQHEFTADMVQVSFSVSAVIFGIAVSILFFGSLSDRLPIHPIILTGGVSVALGGLICAVTENFGMLIAARFFQGIFIPALTTALAAYLAKTLPRERLNVVMGSYISATVLGGLGGRLLGGWIHPPLHWRYAFVSASVFTLITAFIAFRGLPRGSADDTLLQQKNSTPFGELLRRWDLLRIYFCAAGSLFIFSSVFNYLPFRLSRPPFDFTTKMTTLMYFVYVIGIFMGPVAGQIGNRFGTGNTLLGGTFFLGLSLALLLVPSVPGVVSGLLGICIGFFTVHAAAIGSLNRKLSEGQGRANALYTLFYYIGGWFGITVSGFAYKHGGWSAVVYVAMFFMIPPFVTGLWERNPEWIHADL